MNDLTPEGLEALARNGALEQLRQARAEIERLRIIETASIGAHALLADAEAEVERLRGLLAEALDAIPCPKQGDPEGCYCRDQHVDVDRIRREAGVRMICELSELPIDQCGCRVHARQAAPARSAPTIEAKCQTTCPGCDDDIWPGDRITRVDVEWIHAECAE